MSIYNSMIDELKENQIFVFGSNLAGEHIGGAAKQAHASFGAQWEIGEGLTGQSYAFPTLTEMRRKREYLDLEKSVEKLYKCAAKHPHKEFLLTKVGCGIAGYNEELMRSLFLNPPVNIRLPIDWNKY